MEHLANRQTSQAEESGILHFKAVPRTFQLLVEATKGQPQHSRAYKTPDYRRCYIWSLLMWVLQLSGECSAEYWFHHHHHHERSAYAIWRNAIWYKTCVRKSCRRRWQLHTAKYINNDKGLMKCTYLKRNALPPQRVRKLRKHYIRGACASTCISTSCKNNLQKSLCSIFLKIILWAEYLFFLYEGRVCHDETFGLTMGSL